METFTEAGRVLSKANEDAIRAALAALQAVVDKIGGTAAVEAAKHLLGAGTALDEAAIAEDFVALTEKAVRDDGTMTIKVINQGWGSSGYYAKAVLERDGPKVFPSGTKMYADHPSQTEEADRPERSIKDLAAVFTTPAGWREAGPDGPGLYAEARAVDGWKKPIGDMAADIGVSIRALGRARMGEAEGRRGPIVEELSVGRSVDFVTEAGRGGKIVPLAEAARQREGHGPAPAAPGKEDTGMANLTEAEQKQLQTDVKTLTESMTGLATALTALTAQSARMVEGQGVRDAKDFAVNALAALTLPVATRARLAESLALAAPMKDGQLDREAFTKAIGEAAKAEAKYLAEAGGLGSIQGMGESLQESNREEPKPEVLTAQLESAFAGILGSESGAKAAAQGRN